MNGLTYMEQQADSVLIVKVTLKQPDWHGKTSYEFHNQYAVMYYQDYIRVIDSNENNAVFATKDIDTLIAYKEES